MIKIGIAEWCLEHRGGTILKRISELGLTAIQIESINYFNNRKKLTEYQRLASDFGIEISGIFVNELLSNCLNMSQNSVEYQKCYELIQKAIDIAFVLNIPLVCIPSFKISEIKNKEDMKKTADILQQFCSLVEDSSMVIASENTLNFTNNLTLINLIKHPHFKIFFDSLNPIIYGHDISAWIENLWPYLTNQIHVKDGNFSKKGSIPLGEGIGNFCNTGKLLLTLGFEGYIFIENQYFTNDTNLLLKDIDTIKKIYQIEPK